MRGTWHRWFRDVCRFRIWENLLDTADEKWEEMWLRFLFEYKKNIKVLTGLNTYIQTWYSSGFQEGREVLFLATRRVVWQIFE